MDGVVGIGGGIEFTSTPNASRPHTRFGPANSAQGRQCVVLVSLSMIALLPSGAIVSLFVSLWLSFIDVSFLLASLSLSRLPRFPASRLSPSWRQ